MYVRIDMNEKFGVILGSIHDSSELTDRIVCCMSIFSFDELRYAIPKRKRIFVDEFYDLKR